MLDACMQNDRGNFRKSSTGARIGRLLAIQDVPLVYNKNADF